MVFSQFLKHHTLLSQSNGLFLSFLNLWAPVALKCFHSSDFQPIPGFILINTIIFLLFCLSVIIYLSCVCYVYPCKIFLEKGISVFKLIIIANDLTIINHCSKRFRYIISFNLYNSLTKWFVLLVTDGEIWEDWQFSHKIWLQCWLYYSIYCSDNSVTFRTFPFLPPWPHW